MKSTETENIRIFLDTNILIYAYSETEPEKKEKVLSILESPGLLVSTQVINEFIWVMNRKYNIDLSPLTLIVHNIFELYDVAIITQTTINKAITISRSLKYSYWDCLMLSSALESNCDIFYTEDFQHGQIIEDKLKIFNPFI
ncbi:MAG: PIN domain-containing protein [Nitrospirota bacterium]